VIKPSASITSLPLFLWLFTMISTFPYLFIPSNGIRLLQLKMFCCINLIQIKVTSYKFIVRNITSSALNLFKLCVHLYLVKCSYVQLLIIFLEIVILFFLALIWLRAVLCHCVTACHFIITISKTSFLIHLNADLLWHRIADFFDA